MVLLDVPGTVANMLRIDVSHQPRKTAVWDLQYICMHTSSFLADDIVKAAIRVSVTPSCFDAVVEGVWTTRGSSSGRTASAFDWVCLENASESREDAGMTSRAGP